MDKLDSCLTQLNNGNRKTDEVQYLQQFHHGASFESLKREFKSDLVEGTTMKDDETQFFTDLNVIDLFCEYRTNELNGHPEYNTMYHKNVIKTGQQQSVHNIIDIINKTRIAIQATIDG